MQSDHSGTGKGRLKLVVCLVLFASSVLTADPVSSRQEPPDEWRSVRSGVLARLTSIFFVDEKRGWAGGTNGTLLATEDGGENWKRLALPEQQRRETIRDLRDFGSGRSLLLGEYGMFSRRAALGFVERIFILSSADGGRTWDEMRLDHPPVTESPARIVKNNESEIVLEQSKMKRAPDPVLLRMEFADDLHGWACGEGGTIQATHDGGRTWVMQQSPVKKLLYDLAVIDRQKVWIAGAGGTLLVTENGGQTWLERRTGSGETFRAIHFTGAATGRIAGGSIMVTLDGGATWHHQSVPKSAPLNDIHFIGAEGWAVGNDGLVLHTLDGGKTWRNESFDTHAHLTRIHFPSANTGWIVGSNGVMYKLSRPPKNEN
ncbi:MAG: hypothetical protein IPM66_11455 [Acidobacteriota bacterium]|nr:MAG: hypothetical protein IPM66_11455 [Acidobacteriota bacterium]